MSSKKYYKDIDFIRVLSCIAVLLYHLNILKGGYLAVCTFFVLSGYLSCISAFRKEKLSLKEYYLNRSLKIYCKDNSYYSNYNTRNLFFKFFSYFF